MSQRLPVDRFKWIKRLSEFNEDFIKNYDDDSDKGYFLEVDVGTQKIYLIFIVTYRFNLKERKLEKCKKLFVTYITKKTMLCTKSFKTSIKSWINTKKSTQSN